MRENNKRTYQGSKKENLSFTDNKTRDKEEVRKEVFERDKHDYECFLSGDNRGFEQLVLNYKDNLIYFLYHFTKDWVLAEDLAQDAFVEVFVHKERYRFAMNFKTYLFTIGRNKAVDYIRKNSRIVSVDEYPEQVQETSLMEEKVIQEEEKRLLYHLLSQLKPEYQAAINLIDLEELSYAEAAKVLGKSDSQMKILIYRARKALGKLWKKENGSYEG